MSTPLPPAPNLTLVEIKCPVCKGTGDSPHYQFCYHCQGSGKMLVPSWVCHLLTEMLEDIQMRVGGFLYCVYNEEED